ncbi:MAG: helix-turn-helix transcriptional regulator [Calditrichia bacterium]
MSQLNLQEFPEIRRSILSYLKQNGSATIALLSEENNVSYEAIRQQIVQLKKDGWIISRLERPETVRSGRPLKLYSLSTAGDHLFEKQYDELAMELIRTTADNLGMEALKKLLAALTETRVRQWEPRLEGLSLEERLAALQEIYLEGDPYMKVEKKGGELFLVERNCPFLNVAHSYPMMCSVTVSTLSRLLGVRLKREKKFQKGDGCCTFRVLQNQPVDTKTFRFELEDATDG